ncbi:MAG: hypothetical protein ABWY55_09215 [Microbacterium sp.]
MPSESPDERATARRSNHIAPPDGESVPPPVPPRSPNAPDPGPKDASMPESSREEAGAPPKEASRRVWLRPTLAGIIRLMLGAVLGATIESGIFAA